MAVVVCLICDKKFYAKPSHIEKGWGKYCSKRCQSSAQKTGKYVRCNQCGKETYRSIKDHKRSKSGNFFCGKSCQTIWRNSTVYIGKYHANWNGGEASYRSIIKKSGRAKICAKCKNADHRVLAVHHKDKNRKIMIYPI